MKNRNKPRRILALLLAAVMLLPAAWLSACSSGIADPIGDLEDVNAWAPILSEEESEALLGIPVRQYVRMIDYPYYYYLEKLQVSDTAVVDMVFRYNCETGESEPACQDSVCSHTRGSGCPFKDLYFPTSLSVIHGGVVYLSYGDQSTMIGDRPGIPLKWYNPTTLECKTLVKDSRTHYVVGDSIYYIAVDFPEVDEVTGNAHAVQQLWRYDWESGESVYITTQGENERLEPVLIDGKEKVLSYSSIDPAGNPSADKTYLYWVDPNTEARTPIRNEGLLHGVPSMVTGKYLVYDEDTWYVAHEEDATVITHLLNLETGENTVLEDSARTTGHGHTVTDRYFLSLRDDPTGEYRAILHCYDLEKGEWTKQYPLSGEYEAGGLRYYRGRLYCTAWVDNAETGEREFIDLQWDIPTGKQRLMYQPVSIDPADTSSEVSTDILFPSLTDEEAAALFGQAAPVSYVDGDWHYYLSDFSNGQTIYRYNYATGEVEFACKNEGCDHTDDIAWGRSSCPLYQHVTTGGEGILSAMNGKVVRVCPNEKIRDDEWNDLYDENGQPLETGVRLLWYDPETGERRLYTMEYNYAWGNCRRVGDAFYYDKTVYVEETDSVHKELWRLDENGSEPTLAVVGKDSEETVLPYLIDGEVVFLAFSEVGPDGVPRDDYREWVYRVDPETDERTLLYDKPITGSAIDICGNYMLYYEYDTTWYLTHDSKSERPQSLCLVDLSTGEAITVEEENYDARVVALTDSSVLYLRDDPTGEYAYILHCYNYLTKEKREYPLKGDQWGYSDMYYDRGQLYFMHASRETGAAFAGISRDLVIWDIATGAVREISNGSIVKEVN